MKAAIMSVSESESDGVKNEMEECGDYIQECSQLPNLVKEARLSAEKAKNFAVQLTEDLKSSSDDNTKLQQCFNEVSSSLAEAVSSTSLSLSTLESFKSVRKVKIELIIKEEIDELEPLEDTDAVFVAKLEHLDSDAQDESCEEKVQEDLNNSYDEESSDMAVTSSFAKQLTVVKSPGDSIPNPHPVTKTNSAVPKQTSPPTSQKHQKTLTTCPHCDKKLASTRNMREHIQRVHNRIKPFKCEHCDKRFSTAGDLKQHQAVHGMGIVHKCADCGREFNNRDSAILHRKQHAQEHTHICRECGKGFYKSSNLKTHMRRHTGERPYECEYCQKRFGWASGIQRHKKSCKLAPNKGQGEGKGEGEGEEMVSDSNHKTVINTARNARAFSI